MVNLVSRTLRFAYDNDKPVIICYMGDDGFTQRRVYVRKVGDKSITAYCTVKRGLRSFKIEGILSAQIAEE